MKIEGIKEALSFAPCLYESAGTARLQIFLAAASLGEAQLFANKFTETIPDL